MSSAAPDGPAETSIVRRYFAAMDSGDLDAALSFFSDDAIYIRSKIAAPDAPKAEGVEEMSGRDAIAAFFALRGKRKTLHAIELEAKVDGHTWLEGRSTAGDNPSRYFLCHAQINDDGLISRFLAIAG